MQDPEFYWFIYIEQAPHSSEIPKSKHPCEFLIGKTRTKLSGKRLSPQVLCRLIQKLYCTDDGKDHEGVYDHRPIIYSPDHNPSTHCFIATSTSSKIFE